MSEKRVYLLISGVVQGVGYRYFAVRTAEKFEVKGWIRNRFDGKVELEIEGEENNLNLFIEELKIGPWSADVKRIDIEERQWTGKFNTFKVRF